MLFVFNSTTYAQSQIGDPGVTFDQSKFDADWPQMLRWTQTGVTGGIPLLANLQQGAIVTAKTSAGINAAISSCPAGKYVYLPNGTYTIDSQVSMKTNVSLVGQSRTGVTCKITTPSGIAFSFDGINKAGIYKLTIEGGWGTPKYAWNGGTGFATTPGQENNTSVSVKFRNGAQDCWLDDVTVLNSGDHSILLIANHNTIRNCTIDGVHRKDGGYQGYFHVGGADNLVVNNTITHLRHFSMQDATSKYNVIYKNTFVQEISFHNSDGGNNLVEQNTVTLPSDVPNSNPNYFAIMGPWSTQHTISLSPNFIYKNSCIEKNHSGATPWSDNSKIYDGPYEVKPADPYTNFRAMASSKVPTGGTLYPILSSNTNSVVISAGVHTLEAEDATLSGGVTIATNQPSYSGTGFGDFPSANSGYVEWALNTSGLGDITFNFRYANGATNDRPLEIMVNGTVVNPSLSFPSNGSWSWQNTANVTATLKAGANTIRATAVNNYGPIIDYLYLTLDYSTGVAQQGDDFLGQSLMISPNPNDGNFILKYNGSESLKGFNLYSLDGKLLLSRSLNFFNLNEKIDVSSLKSGLYLLNVETEHSSAIKKIAIE